MSAERALLERLLRGPVSGDVLAREAGLTRAAVWKRVEALRLAGVQIDARPGRGYVLGSAMELLDAAVMAALLEPSCRADLSGLEVVWQVDSTNSELLRRDLPAQGAAILLAEQQSGGRGRRGRPWASPLAANLYMSVSRQFGGGLARLGGLSLVAGVSIVETLHALGMVQAGLKWPNDVVVQDRKLAGVLVEGGGEHGGPVRAVIGMGINVRMPAAFAAQIDQPWADLAGLMAEPPGRNVLAAALLSHLLPALDEFDRHGLAAFLPRFAHFDALRGREITVHEAHRVRQGVAGGLADDGALRVGKEGEWENVYAGEVSVRVQ